MSRVIQFNTAAELIGRNFTLRAAPFTMICVDPAGEGVDNVGVVILDRESWQSGEPHDPDFMVQRIYRVRYANYLPNGLEMGAQVSWMYRMHRRQMMRESKGASIGGLFVVETNGVGWGYVSSLRVKVGSPRVVGIRTVGRLDRRVYDGRRQESVSMPRLAGIDHLRLMIETHQVRVGQEVQGEGLARLKKELNVFVWQGNRPEALTGHHDDLVMPLAHGCWVGEKVVPADVVARRVRPPQKRVS